MKINYWDCEYAEAEEVEIGTEDESDFVWMYFCRHPNRTGNLCSVDNQFGGDKGDCNLLGL